jgi:hypothetical protein
MMSQEEDGRGRHAGSNNSNLPGWIISIIALVILGLLVYNIIEDIRLSTYEGYPVTLLLAGFLGGLVGVRRFMGGDGR